MQYVSENSLMFTQLYLHSILKCELSKQLEENVNLYESSMYVKKCMYTTNIIFADSLFEDFSIQRLITSK